MHARGGEGVDRLLEASGGCVEVVARRLAQSLCEPQEALFCGCLRKLFARLFDQATRASVVASARVCQRLAGMKSAEIARIGSQAFEPHGERQVALGFSDVRGPKLHFGSEKVSSGELEAVLGVIEQDDRTADLAQS